MTPLERLELGNVDFGSMTLADIKAIVRKDRVFQHYGLSGTNVAFMTRDECISFLTTGDTSFQPRLASLGNRDTQRDVGRELEKETARRELRASETGSVVTDDIAEDLRRVLERINPGSASLKAELTTYIDHRLDALVDSIPARRIEVSNGVTIRPVEDQSHERLELVLKCLAANVPCALVGPAGSGKSTICRQAAQALGIDYRPMTLNPLTSKSDILGYRDAHGNFHGTLFYLCFRYGGAFVGDEADTTNPGILTILNDAVSSRICSFADGETIEAHPDFRIVICMNTFGTGATVDYVGRNRLDASTLDRFAYIWIDYDRCLEAGAMGATSPRKRTIPDYGANPVKNADHWRDVVTAYRSAAAKLGLRHIISPRASILGMQLAAQGVGVTWLVPMLLHKGLQGEDLGNLERLALEQ